VFKWKGGCAPIYYGRASRDFMSGEGFCTTSDYPYEVTWEATRRTTLNDSEDYSAEGDATEIGPQD
jgi:hypothetical protein